MISEGMFIMVNAFYINPDIDCIILLSLYNSAA